MVLGAERFPAPIVGNSDTGTRRPETGLGAGGSELDSCKPMTQSNNPSSPSGESIIVERALR
jgi:hypothetical protein